MTTTMKPTLVGGSVLFGMFLLSACSTAIQYSPNRTMSFDDARDTAEEVLLTQHESWRPDNVEVTDKYIDFNMGSITHGAGAFGVGVAVATSSTHKRGGRAYYKYVTGIELMTWQRKFRRWYIVLLKGDVALRDPVILRTRDLTKAKRLVDALSSLVDLSKTHATSASN